MNLDTLRNEIDEIDSQLVGLFQRRMKLAESIAAYKQAEGLSVLDSSREQAVLNRAEERTADPVLKPMSRRFFQQLMAMSRERQQVLLAKPAQPQAVTSDTVAFLGMEGSFSHEAALQAFGANASYIPAATFEELVEGVETGRFQRAMLPVENSLTGGIFAAVDLLGQHAVKITGETVLKVRHCLLAVPGASMATIKTAYSHPQPLEQCRRFLRERGLAQQACGSTTEAAQEVARRRDGTIAAIASESAGARYGLVPLLRDIQDDSANFTRFAIIGPADAPDDPCADKVSAVFIVEHRPGTLYGVLRAFADRGVNLLNLLSRPIAGVPWQYCFHMDFGGNLADGNVQEALRDARHSCREILILGNYKKWEG